VIELYHCPGTRSFRALWVLEELELPYRLHILPFPPRLLRPDFLTLNPLGTVPLLLDGTTKMTESAAILQYLATRAGSSPLAVGIDEPDYGLWLDWLLRGEATLTFPQTIVLRYTQHEPEERRPRQVVDDYTQWFFSRLRHVTRALADREWLCAGRFTAADISVGYALLAARSMGLDYKFTLEIESYWQRLSTRPAFLAAIAAEAGAKEGVRG
jgi:glutathione S-transferase